MKRLEEISNRLNAVEFDESGYPIGDFYTVDSGETMEFINHSSADMMFLLLLNKKYKQALEKVNEMTTAEVMFDSRQDIIDSIGRITAEALEKLKESEKEKYWP